MKNFFICAIAFLAMNVMSINAQTEKGKVLVGVTTTFDLVGGGGSDLMGLGFSNVKYKSDADGYDEPKPDKMIQFNLAPKVGFFVVDGLALGLDTYLSFSSNKDGDDEDKSKSTMWSVGPFVRYYIPTSSVKPFFEVNSGFGSSKFKYDYSDPSFDDYDSKSGIISLGGGAGVAVPIGSRVTFDAMLGYKRFTIKAKEDNDDNYRTVVGTFGFNLGFTVML